MTTTILLVDDHEVIRDGLQSLLESRGDCTVVAHAADGRAAVELARQHRPHVVIMDIGMPELNGIEATQQIKANDPAVAVIALSMYADATYVGRMLKAGAAGYLLKESAFEELSAAIDEVRQGRSYLSRGITGVVVADYVQRLGRDPEPRGVTILTAKEREVLQLIAEGRSTKEIAAALHVSVKTIETHRSNIMKRLDIHSIAELTKFAIRHGLTSL